MSLAPGSGQPHDLGDRTLAAVLGAKRDGNATVDSSRALLTTVLGELVLPSGGQAWTQSLIHTMEQLGVQDRATRQAIARLQERNWLKSTRVGRRSRWALTDTSTQLLQEGAARIYGFGQSTRSWDSRWLVVLASVPERDRNLRYRLSVGLNWAGFGSLGQGTWICPWVAQEPIVVRLLDELEVAGATSFVAELGQLGTGPVLAERAWDLTEVRSHYDRFLDEVEPPPRREQPPEQSTSELLMLVHRWRQFPFLDPELPADLLPTDWPAEQAAGRFATLRAELLEPATSWWQATEARFAGT